MKENHETTAQTSNDTVSARLTLDVTYKLNGVAADLMMQNLRKMCERAIGEGMLTGNTEAEVDEYSMDVKEVSQEETSVGSVNMAGLDFPSAKRMAEQLWSANTFAGSAINDFLGKHPRGSMGLTPDSVKEMPEYLALKKACDLSLSKLRNFNAIYVKTFKKEIRADRDARRSSKLLPDVCRVVD